MKLGDPILPVNPESAYDKQLNRALHDYFRRLNTKVNNLAYQEFSVTYDPPSLNDGDGTTTTVTATGATLGQYVQCSFSLDTQGIILYPWVSAADVVSVRFQNETGGIIDLGSGTLKVKLAYE